MASGEHGMTVTMILHGHDDDDDGDDDAADADAVCLGCVVGGGLPGAGALLPLLPGRGRARRHRPRRLPLPGKDPLLKGRDSRTMASEGPTPLWVFSDTPCRWRFFGGACLATPPRVSDVVCCRCAQRLLEVQPYLWLYLVFGIGVIEAAGIAKGWDAPQETVR
jgi:hypothetical protein